MKYKKEWLIFISTFFFLAVFNWDLPITDPVEVNYVLTAKEMLESGDWLSPRIYGAYWYDKPVLTYWLIMASMYAFGMNEFAVRLPMAIAGAGSAAFLYWLVNRLERNCILAGVSVGILVTSLQFWVVCKIVITDAWLFLFHNMAVGWMYLALHTGKKSFALAAYIAAGLAVLTKGPVGAILPVGTLLLYCIWPERKDWRAWRSQLCCWKGGIAFFLVILPWYGYMYIAHGQDFINGFIGLHNVTRAVVSEHPDMNVAYYYFVVVPVALLPWTGVFFKAIGSLIFRKQIRGNLLYFYWIIFPTTFYSFIATKYPTYVFVALFPAAIITAKELLRLLQGGTKLGWFWITVPMVMYFMVLGFGTMKLQLTGAEVFVFFLAAVLLISLFLQWKLSGGKLFYSLIALQAAVVICLAGMILPSYAQMRTAKQLVARIPPAAAVAQIGDYQASAVFYYGKMIPKIVFPNEERPTSVWAGKQQYPLIPVKVFEQQTARRKDVYLIVHEYSNAAFLRMNTAKEYQPIAVSSRGVLYKKVFL